MDNTEEQKAIVPIGPNGLEFKDIDSLYRFAKAVELSGLAPKGLEKKEAIFIALCMAIELRMSPMAALQNIAVINGRPGIFGDAALALVRASGLCDAYSQELTGEGDQRKAVVKSSRAGVEIVNEFSVADAKRAQLWGKSGPWSQYPDRMLIFRARGFNLRDNFGDVLRGFHTTEELADIPEERQVAGRVVAPAFPSPNSRLPEPQDEAPKRPRRRPPKQESEPGTPAIAAVTSPDLDPAAEVLRRLNDANSTSSRFVWLLHEIGMIDCDPADIEDGVFTLRHVSPETLKLALDDWDNVLIRLKAKEGELL